MNINSNVVFYRDFIEDLTGVAKHIPTSAGPSSLVNNGTMNLNSAFGGYINNAASGAIIKTGSNFSNSVTSEEMYGGQSTDSYGQHFTMTVPAVAKIGSKADDAIDAQLKGSSNYTGENGWWKGASGGSTIKESRGDTAESSCVLPGTLITMADGSTKPIEDVHGRDMVLVFNHGTGRYDVAPVMFNDPEPIKQVKVIHCEFDDGTTLGIIDEHGLFDMDLNQYVYITEETMSNYVGHHFFSNQNSLDFNQHRIVTLTRVYVQEEMTACYSITTAKHFNYFTNGLLSLGGGIAGMFNYFDLDADMKVDLVKMKQDIEKYGLFTYDDFKAYLTEEEFNAYNGKYLKVALGKGLLTKRKLEQLIDRYGGKAT